MRRLWIALITLMIASTTQLSVHAFVMHDVSVGAGCHEANTSHDTSNMSLCTDRISTMGMSTLPLVISYNHGVAPCIVDNVLLLEIVYDRISDILISAYDRSGSPPDNFLNSVGSLGHGVKMHC